MYLYQTSNTEFVREATVIAQKEFEALKLHDRIFKVLLNLGLLPSFTGFDILMQLIEKRVLNKNYKIVFKNGKNLAGTINTTLEFAWNNNYINSFFDDMFLCDEIPTIQEFVYKVSTYIRTFKDFDIYFKVLNHRNYVIIASEFKIHECFTPMDIDTRISKFLHTLAISNYSYSIQEVLKIWHFIIKEAYTGDFINIAVSASKLNLNTTFLQSRLNQSLRHMHTHCKWFSKLLFVEKEVPSTLQAILLIAEFLRQNKDIELYYSKTATINT